MSTDFASFDADHHISGSIRARSTSRRLGRRAISQRLLMAMVPVLLACFVSGQLLIHLGWSYVLGSFPEKIHPSTYIASLFVLVQCCSRGSWRVKTVIQQSPAVVYLVGAVLLLTVYAGVVLGVPASGLPDTWILACEFFVLCAVLDDDERRILRIGLDVFMVINSLIGLFEVVTNIQIVPLTLASAILGAYVYPIEWRAGALMGHPLGNAYVTASYILLLLLDQRVKPLMIRLPLLALHGIALVAFGSRGAMGFLAGTLAVVALWEGVKVVTTGRIRKDLLVYIGLGGPAAALAIPVILASGFADRFIQRIEVDHGSASARGAAIEMMSSFTWSELIFGPPTALLTSLGERFGIGAGIENFWLAFAFNYGLIGFVIFMPIVFLFCRDLVRRTGPHAIPVLIFFFVCCTTSVSLASKSLTFSILTALLLTSQHMRMPAPGSPATGDGADLADRTSLV